MSAALKRRAAAERYTGPFHQAEKLVLRFLNAQATAALATSGSLAFRAAAPQREFGLACGQRRQLIEQNLIDRQYEQAQEQFERRAYYGLCRDIYDYGPDSD
jgi:hypothetical protein